MVKLKVPLTLLVVSVRLFGYTHKQPQSLDTYSGVIGTSYRLEAPVFVQRSGANSFMLIPPRYSSEVPVSLEDYQNHPTAWRCALAYVARYPRYKNCSNATVSTYVPTGTIITISKVTQQTGFLGSMDEYWATIVGANGKKYYASLCFLMKYLDSGGSQVDPRWLSRIEDSSDEGVG